MKTLKTLQALSKIGRILSKIVYICCIVGFIGWTVGAAAMLIGIGTVKIGGIELNSILKAEAGVGTDMVWTAIVTGMLLCLGEFFISRMAYRYFDNELNAGTPFTLDGATELMHLGISTVWISMVSVVLARVAQEVILRAAENAEFIDLDNFGSAVLGIVFIIMSLLCKYGAELEQKKADIK